MGRFQRLESPATGGGSALADDPDPSSPSLKVRFEISNGLNPPQCTPVIPRIFFNNDLSISPQDSDYDVHTLDLNLVGL